MRYARFLPGERVGTVEVTCRAAGEGTEAEVVYDMTGRDDVIDEFERAFPQMLADWERWIAP